MHISGEGYYVIKVLGFNSIVIALYTGANVHPSIINCWAVPGFNRLLSNREIEVLSDKIDINKLIYGEK